jgi:radical SAM superfamily enzyme YgiQ (UPF0313 family)
MKSPVRVLLLSTYDLGHQPLGLASPAAWLAGEGHKVTCVDLSLDPLTGETILDSDAVCFYLPMHTATRLAIPVIERVASVNPKARISCYGLYAPLNEAFLRGLGVEAILGGEYEKALVEYLRAPGPTTVVSLDRLQFPVPDRAALPVLERYTHLRINGERRSAGYVEASRGCKHLCKHCPIVPVYQGTFRVVSRETVLEDIRRQVFAGARHITFGDPDFLNGPTHATRIIETLHSEFPDITYDATIKIEHLRKHRDLLPVLKDTGCLFVTSAVESVEDEILQHLDKGHTRADFISVVEDFKRVGLTMSPTFIPFTPWATRAGYQDLLQTLAALDMVASVSPVQLALRLLIPAGSLLLELSGVKAVLSSFEERALLHRWKHADPFMDQLAANVLNLVHREQKRNASRPAVFRKIWELASEERLPDNFSLIPRAAVPYLDEPWYC